MRFGPLGLALISASLCGCWLTKKEISSSKESGSTLENKQTANGRQNIDGAYGWKLDEVIPESIDCKDAGDCGGAMDVGGLSCKVNAKEAMPEDWILEVCVTPKSKRIFKIFISAIGMDDSAETGLKEKLSDKYGSGREGKFEDGDMPMDLIFDRSYTSLTVRRRGPLELIYKSKASSLAASRENEQLEKEHVENAKKSINTNNL